jgi:ribosome biogenesis GTPase A
MISLHQVAPIPGETKVWQYITLMKRINLIDCPGVVYDVGDTETDTVLKGEKRVKVCMPELLQGRREGKESFQTDMTVCVVKWRNT